MNTDDKPRKLTKEQIEEQGRIEAAKRSLTIRSEPLAKPKIEPPVVDPKTTEQSRKAARHELITRRYEQQETESPMTLSGLTEEERCEEKKWLKEERERFRGKLQS